MMMRALVNATVLRCQRSQDQEQQSVRGGVQSKVEEAVVEHRETAGQCAGRDATPELVVSLASRETFAKQHHQKSQAQDATHDAAIGKSLQVIVVSLLQAIVPIPQVITRINHTE